jgi:hypothetical protein
MAHIILTYPGATSPSGGKGVVSTRDPVAEAADITGPPPVRAHTLASWLGTFSVLGFSRMTEKHRSVSSFMEKLSGPASSYVSPTLSDVMMAAMAMPTSCTANPIPRPSPAHPRPPASAATSWRTVLESNRGLERGAERGG